MEKTICWLFRASLMLEMANMLSFPRNNLKALRMRVTVFQIVVYLVNYASFCVLIFPDISFLDEAGSTKTPEFSVSQCLDLPAVPPHEEIPTNSPEPLAAIDLAAPCRLCRGTSPSHAASLKKIEKEVRNRKKEWHEKHQLRQIALDSYMFSLIWVDLTIPSIFYPFCGWFTDPTSGPLSRVLTAIGPTKASPAVFLVAQVGADVAPPVLPGHVPRAVEGVSTPLPSIVSTVRPPQMEHD